MCLKIPSSVLWVSLLFTFPKKCCLSFLFSDFEEEYHYGFGISMQTAARSVGGRKTALQAWEKPCSSILFLLSNIRQAENILSVLVLPIFLEIVLLTHWNDSIKVFNTVLLGKMTQCMLVLFPFLHFISKFMDFYFHKYSSIIPLLI